MQAMQKIVSAFKQRTVMVSIVYAVFSMFIVIFIDYGGHSIFQFHNDFVQYYAVSNLVANGRIGEIYALYDGTMRQAMQVTWHTTPFRYLPSTVMLLVPLQIFSLPVAYCVFTVIGLVLNIITSKYIYKTILLVDHSERSKNIASVASILFLIYPFHMEVYVSGQICPVIAFLLVFSLYQYIKKNDKVASFFLGLSICFKPVAYLVIIFVLLCSKNATQFIKRAVFIAIPISVNLVVFTMYPSDLSGFILYLVSYDAGFLSASVSLTQFLSIFAGHKTEIMVAGFAIISIFFTKKRLNREEPDTKKHVSAFFLGTIGVCMFQADMWSSQTVYIIPFVFFTILDAESIKKTTVWLGLAMMASYLALLQENYIYFCWISSTYLVYVFWKGLSFPITILESVRILKNKVAYSLTRVKNK